MVKKIQVPISKDKYVEIIEPTRELFAGNLGGAVEYSLAHHIFKILEITGGGLGAFAGGFLVHFLEVIEPEMVDYVAPVIDTILSYEDLPPELRKFFEQLRHPKGQAAAAILGGLGSSAGSAVVGSFVNSWTAGLTYKINREIHPARPSPAEALAMLWREAVDPEKISGWLQDIGYDTDAIGGYLEILKPRTTVGDLLAFYWRTEKSPEGARAELNKRGYTDDEIDKLMELSKFIPTAGDLIRMAVREAWNDEAATRFGYDEGRPPEFDDWAERVGMSKDWAMRYWRAHWNLPGLYEARDMLHRTDMSEDDYKLLLKIADYPIKWREWLTETAYLPYNRVDVRRMYRTGTLKSFEEVKKAYLDLGYNDEKAGKLAEFTVMEYGEEVRELTKSDILTAYSLHRISHDEAKTYLTGLGYQDWVSEANLARVDIRESNRIAKETIRHVRTMYVNWQYDKTDVVSELSKIPLPSDEIQKYLDEWDIPRQARVGRPTRSELRKFFLENLIDEPELRRELIGYKMPVKYIDWFVADLKQELAREAKDEAEKARKEAERIRKSELKTAYDIQIADINVKIAEDNVAIADLKLAVVTGIKLEELESIKLAIAQYKDEIARLRKEKAELRKKYLTERST